MKKALVALTVLAIFGCSRSDQPSSTSGSVASSDRAANQHAADNTGVNVRDRDGNALTAQDQAENATDRAVTQKVRQAITADSSLSTDAHNVKVITSDGVVTLRGPVTNPDEKSAVAAKAQQVPGVKRVENQLEVATR